MYKTPIATLQVAAWTFFALAGSAGAVEVTVDCSQPGRSIQRVLDRAAESEDLRIEVLGTCRENVVISRDRVELVGGAPGAEIRTPEGDRTSVPLRIEDANDIVVSALALTGALAALEVQHSGPDILVSEIVMTDNANGLIALRSTLRMTDATIASEYSGVALTEFSSVLCSRCEVDATDIALLVAQHSTLVLAGGDVENPLSAAAVALDASLLDLRSSELMGGVELGGGSRLLVTRESALAGASSVLSLRGLSSALIESDSSAVQLLCSEGSDVWCQAGATVVGSNCASCP